MVDWAVTFTRPDGQVVDLDDGASYFVNGPVLEIGMPEVEHQEYEVADLPGSVPYGVKIKPRELSVPVAILGVDSDDVTQRARWLISSMNPLLGMGVVTLEHKASGHARRIAGKYQAGLGLELSLADWGGASWSEQVLVFRCFDPFWTDATDNEVTWRPIGDVLVPFFPIGSSDTDFGPHFGTSSVFGDELVQNTGDIEAWPVWSLHGPFASPQLRNATTDEVMDFSANGGLALGVDDVLSIDTTPTAKTVTVNGDNAFEFLTAESTLWSMPPGDNVVQVAGGGAGVESSILFGYRLRYLSL